MSKLLISSLILFTLAVSNLSSQEYRKEYELPLDDAGVAAAWKSLKESERDQITLRNLHGLVRAMHKYHAVHGTFPPVEIPNLKLPAEKRLSGLVLLLPYLEEATYLHDGKQGPKIFDQKSAEAAKKLYQQIDRSRAWDDPKNLDAAKALVPAFLIPGTDQLRDKKGLAVSHVALVRGSNGTDDGVFTLKPKNIRDIRDGTVNTLAIGQINSSFGPWIAAGNSTSRYLFTKAEKKDQPTFGSALENGSFFANCDSFSYFLDTEKTSDKMLSSLSTASKGDFHFNGKIVRFKGVKDWKEKNKQ